MSRYIVYCRVQKADQAHQLAESRLSEETQQRLECERMIQTLEIQLREAERDLPAALRREIHLSQQELGI